MNLDRAAWGRLGERNVVQRPEAAERSPLAHALAIPGADAVALIAVEGRSLTWWAGGRTPDDDAAAGALALAEAARSLVRITDPDDELGDVLVTSASAFHVLRMIRSASGEPQVAHLTLRRGGANLAMARQEFKVLTERYVGESGSPPRQSAAGGPFAVPADGDVTPPQAGAEAAQAGAGAAQAGAAGRRTAAPAAGVPEVTEDAAADGASADPPDEPVGPPPLPRRRPSGVVNGPPAVADGTGLPSNWLVLFGQPFTTDEAVLERVLGTLRHL